MSLNVVETYGTEWLLVKTKMARQIALAIPECYVSSVLGDGERLVVPLRLDIVQKVAEWRIPVMSPMMRDYEFKGRFKPYTHQLKICSFLTCNRKGFCLADMGTGKTLSAVWALDYLFEIGEIKRALVIGPMSNMSSTWGDEFFNVNPNISVTVLHTTEGSAARAEMARDNAQVHIINHDGVELILKQLMKNNYDVIVVDELTAFKNANAQRSKAVQKICAQARYAWGLTGTPMPNKPDETYGQIKVIRPDNLEKMSYTRYKERVMVRVTDFIWKARFDAQDTVASYMQPAIKIDKADVLTLPTLNADYIPVPLSQGQKEFYETMAKDKFVGDGTSTITAVNGGALMVKLLQVATGAIYDDAGQALKFDVSARVDKTIELIRDARERSTDKLKGKTIVFAPFRHTVSMLERELSKHFNVACITGDTSAKKRANIFAEFQTSEQPDVIIAVAQTMSHGVTATSASCIVWFGPVTSNETYQQACNRIDRPGQTQEMTIHHLYSTKVEEKLYKTLRERKLSQADLLNLYTDFVRGL